MTEAAREVGVAVVRDGQKAVFDAKCVRIVVTEIVTADLYDPAVEIASVEELEPSSGGAS